MKNYDIQITINEVTNNGKIQFFNEGIALIVKDKMKSIKYSDIETYELLNSSLIIKWINSKYNIQLNFIEPNNFQKYIIEQIENNKQTDEKESNALNENTSKIVSNNKFAFLLCITLFAAGYILDMFFSDSSSVVEFLAAISRFAALTVLWYIILNEERIKKFKSIYLVIGIIVSFLIFKFLIMNQVVDKLPSFVSSIIMIIFSIIIMSVVSVPLVIMYKGFAKRRETAPENSFIKKITLKNICIISGVVCVVVLIQRAMLDNYEQRCENTSYYTAQAEEKIQHGKVCTNTNFCTKAEEVNCNVVDTSKSHLKVKCYYKIRMNNGKSVEGNQEFSYKCK